MLIYLSKWIPSSISTCDTMFCSLVVHFSNRKQIPVFLMKCSFFLIVFILMRMSKMRESQTERLHPTHLQPTDVPIAQTQRREADAYLFIGLKQKPLHQYACSWGPLRYQS